MGNFGNDGQAATIAEIKAQMDVLGWKQPDLVAASGVPTSSLHRYLAGTRDIPLPVVVEIARALGLTHIELFKRAQRQLDAGSSESRTRRK
ncbi:hypothetical protein GCM10023063_15070 [Arthrobacter methylotrophus]|uniref:Helix-turn-helix domain-containing protein n=1 Tax=Arthrobacter methylotrophus TaxID=121291 RepID=A0ABV5UN32_9MICC